MVRCLDNASRQLEVLTEEAYQTYISGQTSLQDSFKIRPRESSQNISQMQSIDRGSSERLVLPHIYNSKLSSSVGRNNPSTSLPSVLEKP